MSKINLRQDNSNGCVNTYFTESEESKEDNDTIYRALEELSLLKHENTLLVICGLYKLGGSFALASMRVYAADYMWENREDTERLNIVIKLCKSRK